MASNFSAITEPKINQRNHRSRIVEILSKLCLLKVNVAKYVKLANSVNRLPTQLTLTPMREEP